MLGPRGEVVVIIRDDPTSGRVDLPLIAAIGPTDRHSACRISDTDVNLDAIHANKVAYNAAVDTLVIARGLFAATVRAKARNDRDGVFLQPHMDDVTVIVPVKLRLDFLNTVLTAEEDIPPCWWYTSLDIFSTTPIMLRLRLEPVLPYLLLLRLRRPRGDQLLPLYRLG